MMIRRETESDYPLVYELISVAFQTARVADGDEQDYVSRLRTFEGYLPELALLADDGDKLMGHIMITKTHVNVKGEKMECLFLAVLSVVLDKRNKGLGAALARECLVRAKKMGFGAVFVVGDPEYYSRFGFREGAKFGVKLPGVRKKNFMALELVPGALKGARGGKLVLP